jgi:hypothetical protein
MKSNIYLKIRLIVFLVILMICNHPSFAKKVDKEDLYKVISNLLKFENKEFKKIDQLLPIENGNDSLIYIAIFKDQGFLILSADNSCTPILGECLDGTFDPKNNSDGLNYLIENYKLYIKNLQSKKITPNDSVQYLWEKYLSPKLKSSNQLNDIATTFVSPLCSTQWHQGYKDQDTQYNQPTSFNRYCPKYCLAGCGAVALAQVLYRWNYSVKPTGGNTFAGQTVNFGNEKYCWESMSLITSDVYNSKLIYHAGVSCSTTYCAPGAYNMSSTTTVKIKNALTSFWGMNANLRDRSFYFLTWKKDLKNELNCGRPIIYAGGEHIWVIEGYNSNDNFYCNWGDGANKNSGYFALGHFDGPEGGGWNYNTSEQAIFSYPIANYTINLQGPDVLTSSATQYTIINPFNCQNAIFSSGPNIASVYGGSNSYVVRATGKGISWIDVSYTINGKLINAPRKYINCLP